MPGTQNQRKNMTANVFQIVVSHKVQIVVMNSGLVSMQNAQTQRADFCQK